MQFDHYGSADVLRVADVTCPSAGDGQVLVRVAAAGINPGEIVIRNGAMEQMFPAIFPSGQSSDFAGRVAEAGSEPAATCPATAGSFSSRPGDGAARTRSIGIPHEGTEEQDRRDARGIVASRRSAIASGHGGRTGSMRGMRPSSCFGLGSSLRSAIRPLDAWATRWAQAHKQATAEMTGTDARS